MQPAQLTACCFPDAFLAVAMASLGALRAMPLSLISEWRGPSILRFSKTVEGLALFNHSREFPSLNFIVGKRRHTCLCVLFEKFKLHPPFPSPAGDVRGASVEQTAVQLAHSFLFAICFWPTWSWNRCGFPDTCAPHSPRAKPSVLRRGGWKRHAQGRQQAQSSGDCKSAHPSLRGHGAG